MTAVPPRAAALRFALAFATTLLLPSTGCTGEKSSASATPASRNAIDRVDQESTGEVVISRPSTPYTGRALSTAGTVSGTVTLRSPLKPFDPVPSGRDSAVCGATIPDSSLERRGSGVGDVVVWLEGVRAGKPIPLEKRLELESDKCLLTPRVQGAVVGSAVNVIGHDDFRQHLRFLVAGETQPRAAVLLGRDEQVIPTELPAKSPGLVVVRDADHPWVRGYVAVFDHPYFAVTKPDGSFTIDGVPPGKYTLVAWHERAKRTEQPVEVPAHGAAKADVVLEGK
ncbi:MAG TPA: carboxypeptidase regulatory-like domain-containing protein [Gemmatimonadaceae bacterium]